MRGRTVSHRAAPVSWSAFEDDVDGAVADGVEDRLLPGIQGPGKELPQVHVGDVGLPERLWRVRVGLAQERQPLHWRPIHDPLRPRDRHDR